MSDAELPTGNSQDIAGIEIVGDLKDCDCEYLLSIKMTEFKKLISDLLNKYNLTELQSVYHEFDVGFTGVVALAESHFAVHTWPMEGYVSVNLFVCNHTRDNSEAAHALFDEISTHFRSNNIVKSVLERKMR